ncbi:unnamed protein product [Gemmata massiliana]|uniref:Uncharacterized protein n=1 Tax=Gemmata massiliana TaxID=1210884 RepID=A0A6P2D6V5_9BACT|nr:unnamed protein product [Gemmata massiliana]
MFKPLGGVVSGLMQVLSPVARTFGQLVDLFAAMVRPINEIQAGLTNSYRIVLKGYRSSPTAPRKPTRGCTSSGCSVR